jgi:hypothetical protein
MTTAAIGAEKPIRLKQALGLDKVEADCTACHSLDYVQMNSNFLNAAGWNAEVAKMINAFGAPISSTDAKIIAEYLTANYGVKVERRRSPAPADRSRAAGAQQPGKHRLGMGLLWPIHAKPSAGSRAHLNRPLIHREHHAIAVLSDQKCSARLVDHGIFMTRGFEHTAQFAFPYNAAAGRLLGLSESQIANALAMAASGDASFAVIRAKPLSQWKGLASAQQKSG